MNAYSVREGDLTFEEFLDLVEDGQKADLLDGVIYMASPDNTLAGDLNGWLYAILRTYVGMKEIGKVYVSRVAFRLDKKQGPEPDIGFVPKEMAGRTRRGYIDGPPALAVEIVSPDSVGRDYILKRSRYEKAGVTEYWIIDPDKEKATFLRLVKGSYKAITTVHHIFTSKVIPGLSLDVRWFWALPRPPEFEIVKDLLRKEQL